MIAQPAIILVTGATDGIGLATALELARRGARVILHGRSSEKIQQAQAAIYREVRRADLESAIADLSSLDQVAGLAHEIQTRFDHLDVLLHNAGVFMRQRTLSEDGFELTLSVNHLAPFALTRQLLPMLRSSKARVVTVSSMVHRNGRINFSDLQASKDYDGYEAYAQSKLANILFANELAERELGVIASNSLHPGVISTKLLTTGFQISGANTAIGAMTSVHLATSPKVATVTGKYFEDCFETPPAPRALDKEIQKRLWEVSEQMAGKWQ